MINSTDLITIFDTTFQSKFDTILRGGADEPLYQPISPGHSCHVIYFRHDYPASALHEVAHWCVAGPARRQQVDYGYWYAPDGRTESQQIQFEQVEVKPQAMEWLFSAACGLPFRVSADNLEQGLGASASFKQDIARQAKHYFVHGLPVRGAAFFSALQNTFGRSDVTADLFDAARLC